MIPDGFKPMLAINADKVSKSNNTIWASEKLDGVRVIFFGGVAYSRSLKPLPNKKLQALALNYSKQLEGCDGEIIAGPKHAKDVLQRTTSFAMKADAEDNYHVYLFDRYDAGNPYQSYVIRFEKLCDAIEDKAIPRVSVLEHYAVKSDKHPEGIDLDGFEKKILAAGGEGVMLKDYTAFYKFGRSGKIKPELQKLKRFDDEEFEITGFTQFEVNTNEAQTNELGRTFRSTSKEGKVPIEALGSLVCTLKDGKTFNVGTGFSEADRFKLWGKRNELLGKFAKVQFFGYSPDGIPLLPVFLAFRDEIDM